MGSLVTTLACSTWAHRLTRKASRHRSLRTALRAGKEGLLATVCLLTTQNYLFLASRSLSSRPSIHVRRFPLNLGRNMRHGGASTMRHGGDN